MQRGRLALPASSYLSPIIEAQFSQPRGEGGTLLGPPPLDKTRQVEGVEAIAFSIIAAGIVCCIINYLAYLVVKLRLDSQFSLR